MNTIKEDATQIAAVLKNDVPRRSSMYGWCDGNEKYITIITNTEEYYPGDLFQFNDDIYEVVSVEYHKDISYQNHLKCLTSP